MRSADPGRYTNSDESFAVDCARQHGRTLVPQLRTLALLSQGLGVSVSDVAAHLDVTTPTASALVERLVRKDYVQRRHDPAERRRVILTATQKAAKSSKHHELMRRIW